MSYVLFTPGPVNLDSRVKDAAVSVDLCHRQEDFLEVIDRVREKLLRISCKEDANVSLLQGSGALAVESGLSSFVMGNVLLIVNGYYSHRMWESLKNRNGVYLTVLKFSDDCVPDASCLKSAMAGKDWVVLAHHETGVGLLTPLGLVCDLAAFLGVRVLVDAVSSFGCHHVDTRADVICFNSNKCLESIPGVAIVIWDSSLLFRDSCIPCLDVRKYCDNIEYTANTNSMLALDVALDLWFQEDRKHRYDKLSESIRDIGSRTFKLFLDDNYSSVATSFYVGDGNKYSRLYSAAKESGYIIYSGKIPGQFRVCNMGVLITEDNIRNLFGVLYESVC